MEANVHRGEPVAAAAYIRHQRLAGKIFNSYRFGAYLLWCLHPDIRVYVDGRTDLSGDALLSRYRQITSMAPGWRAALQQLGVDLLVLRSMSPLERALRTDVAWRRVFADRTATVLAGAPKPPSTPRRRPDDVTAW